MTAVAFEDVEMAFPQPGGEPVTVLEDFSFTVPEGSIFCLLGPNGSGKTTTINLIVGLLRPSNGRIRVLGADPLNDARALRERLSLVPQDTPLYADLTGRENLEFHARYYGVPKQEQRDRVDEALDLVGLEGRQHDRVGTYSGGMKRRLALGRSLLTEPDLILLDEPTLGVDVQSRSAIWERCRELAATGTTILLTTNYMEEADALAEEILILDQGNQVVSGSPDELKRGLEARTLVVEFQDETAARAAWAGPLNSPDAVIESTRVRLPASEKDRVFEVLGALEAHASSVNGFEMREPTLNDVFLHFTGRQLRD